MWREMVKRSILNVYRSLKFDKSAMTRKIRKGDLGDANHEILSVQEEEHAKSEIQKLEKNIKASREYNLSKIREIEALRSEQVRRNLARRKLLQIKDTPSFSSQVSQGDLKVLQPHWEAWMKMEGQYSKKMKELKNQLAKKKNEKSKLEREKSLLVAKKERLRKTLLGPVYDSESDIIITASEMLTSEKERVRLAEKQKEEQLRKKREELECRRRELAKLRECSTTAETYVRLRDGVNPVSEKRPTSMELHQLLFSDSFDMFMESDSHTSDYV